MHTSFEKRNLWSTTYLLSVKTPKRREGVNQQRTHSFPTDVYAYYFILPKKKTAFFKFNSSDYLDHIKVLLAEGDTEALI